MKQLSLHPEKAKNRAIANDFGNKNKASGSFVQTKLTVGEPGDKYEQEADQVADKVMNMPEPAISKAPADDEDKIQAKLITSQITPLIQRQSAEEEEPLQTKLIQKQEDDESLQAQYIQRESQEEDDKLQTKLIQRQPEEEEGPIQAKYIQKRPEEEEEALQTKQISRKGETSVPQESNWLENQLQGSKGSGSPLPNDIKTSMETRFGTDFSQVKIHTGTSAVQMNKELNAQAFTHGNDVYFNSGKYSPESSSGRHLLAHELTHTIQQKSSKSNQLHRQEAPKVDDSIPGPGGKVFRVADRNALIRNGEPKFTSTGNKIARGTDVEIVSFNKTKVYALVKEVGAKDNIGWTSFSNLIEKLDTSVFKTTGTLSEVSWGETSGLYPSKQLEYSPDMWDAGLTGILLAARRAIHEIGKRGQSVHRAKPSASDIMEQKLKTYHLIENFPALDAEIVDPGVKWFYLSNTANQQKHPGLSQPHERVKSYGPFFNNGGGDVPRGGGVYLHFFKLKS
jgi:hypothetical protein